MIWMPGDRPRNLVQLADGRFVDRKGPGRMFAFGADSATSTTLSQLPAPPDAASVTAGGAVPPSQRLLGRAGWLTIARPGLVLSGRRVSER